MFTSKMLLAVGVLGASAMGLGMAPAKASADYVPARVVYAPAPVYYAPAPVVYAPPASVYYTPAPAACVSPVVVERRPVAWSFWDHDGRRDWDRRDWGHRDFDRDHDRDRHDHR